LILGEIAEFFLEALLELIAAAILALVSRALLGLFRDVAEPSIITEYSCSLFMRCSVR